MFEKFSLKEQFKVLLFPIMLLSILTIGYIAFNQYKETIKIENLGKTVELVEEIKKIINLINRERFTSLMLLEQSDKKRMLRALSRNLRKERKINNVRLKALQTKIDALNAEGVNKVFINNVQKAINFFENKKFRLRKNIDKKLISKFDIINEYTRINGNFIDSITDSLETVENVELAQNIFTYSLFLNYKDFFSVENIMLQNYIKNGLKFENQDALVQYSNFRTKINFLKRLATGIVSEDLIYHYIRLISEEYYSKIIHFKERILFDRGDLRVNYFDDMKLRDFAYLTSKTDRKIKELGDYISREINTSIKQIIDTHYRNLFILIISMIVILSIILSITYTFYNYLQDTIFFSILKMKTKIVKTVKDRNVSTFNDKNEIKYLLKIVDGFTESVKTFIIRTKKDFNEIEVLSTKLSQSSERMVNHLYKQIQYIDEINFKLDLFYDLMQNNSKGFENLKDLLNNSLSKTSNLSLDIIYVSYETLNLQDTNQKSLDELKEELETSQNFLKMLDNLEKNGKQDSSDDILLTNLNYKTIVDFVKDVNKLYEAQIKIMNLNVEKLQNLSKTTLSIKNESESNNAHLEDMLSLIATIHNETLTIKEEVSETINESKTFSSEGKDIIKNGEYVYSDISLLHRFTVNLNMEFNKFRV
jgi:hypothetical protein